MARNISIKILPILPEIAFIRKRSDRVIKAIEGVFNGEVSRILVSAMDKRVRGWDEEPNFSSKVTSTTSKLELLVKPDERTKGGKRWVFVSLGTPSHAISARRAPSLIFQTTYIPHTQPGNLYGGPGSRSGPYVYPHSVMHPGTKARNFEEHIAKEEEGKIQRAVNKRVIKALL